MEVLSIFKNKVVFYLASRYITYGVQFITSLVIAAELGPYYMGIWGFILLLLQYFQQFHLGIANSFNVLYVHHRNNEQECNNYIGNSLVLISYLAIFVIVFFICYLFGGIAWWEKYHADKYIVWVCLIAILQYFVQFFINLFRVKNQLNRVTFCQSIVVVLNFICIFFFRGELLISWLVAGYVIGNILCAVLALTSKSIPRKGKIVISISYQREILRKGVYLFFYNSCFYFIIISIRTIISGYYSVEDFGTFSFSFSLAHAILLLLEAMSFVIFPKIVGRLSLGNSTEVMSVITKLRTVYITSAHLLIYIGLLCFPILLLFFPKYNGALLALNLIALTILMNTNSYGYTELLISRNQERLAAIISAIALVINCALALLFVLLIHCSYEYVILATMVTYLIFSGSVMCCARKLLGMSMSLSEWFPIRLFVPFLFSLTISVAQYSKFLFIPFVLFVFMNIKQIREILNTSILLVKNPSKVNL